MYQARYAILVDGGFVTKKLQERNGKPATADDIADFCETLTQSDLVRGYELLRIYYYDAPPSSDKVRLPMSGNDYPLANTRRYSQAQRLYDGLVIKPGFALRMGETRLSPDSWKLKAKIVRQLKRSPRSLTDDDFDLDIGQKGVDLRIGLDMARLALRDLVRAMVVVTGDSDFVPAFKFVRREGVKVILETMGHKGARPELKHHADYISG